VGHARLHGTRSTGGAVEVLVVGIGDEGRWDGSGDRIVALSRSNRVVRVGEEIALDAGGRLRLVERGHDGLTVWDVLADTDIFALLDGAGDLPLPPYILRARRSRSLPERWEGDPERYQTVFASTPGAVAAPTASLHFDASILSALDALGVRRATVTLHVGIGTFRPVSAERLSDHTMHSEFYRIPSDTVEAIRATRNAGGRVIAVGTTVVRTLEAASIGTHDGLPRAGEGQTDLMIRPGHVFRSVDALVTNFHLPRSTLLALVAAFGGYEFVREAYEVAVRDGFRFFSYGDAMFIAHRAADRP
jgi:S-adenosylmethionine:tRNA ribosyltransferase-isomerase